MIYTLIKLPIRLALRIFCVDIDLVNPGYRSEKGPLLLVANHPNSFLDAILIAAQFREPVYFLARGDAFRKPWQRFLLGLLHMVPIYRLSEGRENLHLNEYAFKQSQALLTEGKIVLIFIEGICLNTHELQPFKKGAARIALTAVGESLPLNIMPVSLSYNNFTSIGKTVRIELSKPFSAKEILIQDQEALNMQYFNHALFLRLDSMIKPPEPKQQKRNIIFFLFSVAGYFLHLPLYSMVKKFVRKKTRQTVFYDSVLFGVLLLLYPLYLLLLFALLALLHVPIVLIVPLLFIHPISAWFAVRYKIKSQTSS
ncbi:1-acyl-sn-glycerol-3-phosphate acyltransferase [Sediminibacterium sp.]|uniref:1-acyl-sn-glycerol-3-phosphate acyltransferase n=1 Tax=Sediminibacterium sp. TaxID=1917865 RepID=UPI0025DBFD85|nr:1-acyl-sn-glycerol-3-phosphate acyltransferase [Sediminibacterium sp.]MBW0176762.1 1-acyl-sn-glycerol-3-phosphate acyltransferase [Sediminibacterium sp.]